MPITRYIKTPDQLASSTSHNQDVTNSLVTNVIVDYLTDPAAARECLPPHFEKDDNGLIRVTLSNVAVQLNDLALEFGAANVAVPCSYKGEYESYCLHMYMSQETAVISGREIYGEPKKLADISFVDKDEKVKAAVTRHFCPFIQFEGETQGEPLPIRDKRFSMFLHKAFPATEGSGFEYSPRLNRFIIETEQQLYKEMTGTLSLMDSPLDPIADLPIKEVVSMHYEVGTSRSSGEFIEEVPAENVAPYYHHRNDELDALLG